MEELLHSMSKKILKPFKAVVKYLSSSHQFFGNDDRAFMTCVIKVNTKKRGWQRAVLKLLRNCKGLRFKMDNDGLVEVSGITDPNRLLNKLGKSRKVQLQWYQFGQCSDYLIMPPEARKKLAKEDPPAPAPAPPPNPPHYGYPTDEYVHGHGYYPLVQDGYGYYPPALHDGYRYHPNGVHDGHHYPFAALEGYGYHPDSVQDGYHHATQYLQS